MTETSTNDLTTCRINVEPLSSRLHGGPVKSLLLVLLAGAMTLSACGGGNSNGNLQILPTLSGNWQFAMAAPADGSFVGGLQGGFLLQTNGSATGAVQYSVALPTSPNPTACNSGSATITGTVTASIPEQTITLTAVAGTQTFTFTGTLSLDGSTMVGTYNSTAGIAADGTPCGTTQTGLQWNALQVPALIGTIQGTFHSTGGPAGLNQQDFLVSGVITQGANTGTDNATVTGNLSFINGATNLSDYPCLVAANVEGEISGNSVVLQLLSADGSLVGQIGPAPGSPTAAVTFNHTQNGYAMQSLAGAGYAVFASGCGGGSLQSPEDTGNVCLALNSTTACQQPITLVPSGLIFPSQTVDSPSTIQAITLTNTSGTTLGGLTLTLLNNSGAANFTETDTCGLEGAPSQGQPFDLNPQQSCVITIAFTPLESCAAGASAAQCLTATLSVSSPNNDAVFTVPITGGVNASGLEIR